MRGRVIISARLCMLREGAGDRSERPNAFAVGGALRVSNSYNREEIAAELGHQALWDLCLGFISGPGFNLPLLWFTAGRKSCPGVCYMRLLDARESESEKDNLGGEICLINCISVCRCVS